jgi:hypothetical protein
MIPFFYAESFLDRRAQRMISPTLAMVASVVATVSGVMTGGLYLFLKSSTLATISPRDKIGEYERRRAAYKNDSDDSDDEAVINNVLNPVSGPTLYRTDSEASLVAREKEEEAMAGQAKEAGVQNGRRSPETSRTKSFVSSVASVLMPRAPEPARMPFSGVSHARKRSYSLFPKTSMGPRPSMTILPATTYNPADALKPPPSMANLANKKHRRDSSLVSSATVQIGIRLSSVDDLPAKKAEDDVVHTLDCPKVAKQGSLPSPKRAGTIASSPTAPAGTAPPPPPPATLAVIQQASVAVAVPGAVMVNTVVPGGLKTTAPAAMRQPTSSSTSSSSSSSASSSSSPASSDPTSDEYTLSPTVYSPDTPTTKAKLPSPRGVGFTVPPQSSKPKTTTTAAATVAPAAQPSQTRPPTRVGSTSPRSPPRRSPSGRTPLPPDAPKAEWI